MRLTRQYRLENDLLHINRVESIHPKTAALTIGWQVRFKRKSGYHSKFFSDENFEGNEGALLAAREYRNNILRNNNEEIGQNILFRSFTLPDLPKNNTSGILGVSRANQREKSGSIFNVWSASYKDENGKTKTGAYRIHLFGEVGALVNAIKFRRDGINLHRTLAKSTSVIEKLDSQIEIYNRLIEFFENSTSEESENIAHYMSRTDVPTSTKKRYVETRVTQTKFRELIRSYYKNRCAITGSSQLLVASHIKPWSVSNDKERIDPYNGILLSAAYDKAFDIGLITFDSNGKVVISPQFKIDAELIGIRINACISGYTPVHDRYMNYHRSNIFKR